MKFVPVNLLCVLLLLPACDRQSPQSPGGSFKTKAIRLSFLTEATALDSTIKFLKESGCSNDGLTAFEKAVRYYNFLPLTLDCHKFPDAGNGFFTFQSVTQLMSALPQKLCDARHPFQLSCYDTVIFIGDGQLTSSLGPDEVFGCSLAPRIETNCEVTLSPVATARDAFMRSCPLWYQDLTEGFIVPGSLKSRANLMAALFSYYPLPGATNDGGLAKSVLKTLQANWKRQGVRFPRDCELVLCHDVRLDKLCIFTVHAGLLFRRNGSFTYIEKDGGCGPFVRLDFNVKAELLTWLSGQQYGERNSKEKPGRVFATFNANTIEEL